jgi:hypothetical protein
LARSFELELGSTLELITVNTSIVDNPQLYIGIFITFMIAIVVVIKFVIKNKVDRSAKAEDGSFANSGKNTGSVKIKKKGK